MNKILDKVWFGLFAVSFFWVLFFVIFGPLIIGLSCKGYYSYLGLLTYLFYSPLIEEFYPQEKSQNE